jgi:hypothetical protein
MMRKRKKGEKPKPISIDARRRIRGYVRAMRALGLIFGVRLSIENNHFVFRDIERTDEWDGYGDWDARIYGLSLFGTVEFEDFMGWGR